MSEQTCEIAPGCVLWHIWPEKEGKVFAGDGRCVGS
jgi:hypothetical protein